MRNRIVELIRLAALKDASTVFMTGDIGYSVVEKARETLGDRFINTGVAEANMATMAAAMAMSGLRVYIYSITPFVTLRCFEQIRNDICYQGHNVRIVGVGAGYSYGSLGPSHHALEDATVLGSLPGMTVLCPAGCAELDALFQAYDSISEPIYFRIGRETGPDLSPPALSVDAPAWIVRDGTAATALCSGAVVEKALAAADRLAAEGLSLRVVSVPVMEPFPADAVEPLLAEGPVVTVCEAYEGNPLDVGAMRLILSGRRSRPFASVCIRKEFPKMVGNHDALRAAGGLSTERIVAKIRELAALRQMAANSHGG